MKRLFLILFFLFLGNLAYCQQSYSQTAAPHEEYGNDEITINVLEQFYHMDQLAIDDWLEKHSWVLATKGKNATGWVSIYDYKRIRLGAEKDEATELTLTVTQTGTVKKIAASMSTADNLLFNKAVQDALQDGYRNQDISRLPNMETKTYASSFFMLKTIALSSTYDQPASHFQYAVYSN